MRKLILALCIVCIAVPAVAADWQFYGSVRMSTFRSETDADDGSDSDADTIWAQQGNSRIGARVTFNEEIGGRFEMGDAFNKRLLFGTYNFGNNQLLLGQTYSPSSSLFYSTNAYKDENIMLGIGQFYTGRQPVIQWKNNGFKLALVTPYNVSYGYDVDVDLPKIELAYNYKSKIFFVDVFGGYQTYSLDGAEKFDIDSYVMNLGGGVNLGPVTLKLNGHFGQNYGNYGSYNPMNISDEAVIVNGELKDCNSLGFLSVLSYTISDRYVMEAGYGHIEGEVEDSNNKEKVDKYYLNCRINITQNFFILPEVGISKSSNDLTQSEPEEFWWGAMWRIDF